MGDQQVWSYEYSPRLAARGLFLPSNAIRTKIITMSKEVDALVLVGHSFMISQEATDEACHNISWRLRCIRNDNLRLDGSSWLTEDVETNLYAGETFLKLGVLAVCKYSLLLPRQPLEPNPFNKAALRIFGKLIPTEGGQLLSPKMVNKRSASMNLNEQQLPTMFGKALRAKPSITDELQEKWAKAQAVHAEQGRVMSKASGSDESTSSTETGVQSLEMPYQKLSHKNGAEMLARALIDLQLVRRAIT